MGPCRERPLCPALHHASSNELDLDFYITAHPESNGSDYVTIHTPFKPSHVKRYGESLPSGGQSLRDLAKIGYFSLTESMDFVERTGGKENILDIGQRTALAKRLIASLMLYIHSSRTIDVWSPENIRFLHPIDKEFTLMVPIYESRGSQVSWSSQPLELLDQLGLEDGDYDQVLPMPFYDLAKKLVLIADGSLLEHHEIQHVSKYNKACVKLRRLIRERIQTIQKISQEKNDLNPLPFLNAARNCLYFHEQYPTYLVKEPSGDQKEAAFKLVFEQILTMIDERLELENPVQLAGVEPSITDIIDHNRTAAIPTVAVFDGTACPTGSVISESHL